MIVAVAESKVALLITSASAYDIQFPQRDKEKNGLRVVRGRSKLTPQYDVLYDSDHTG